MVAQNNTLANILFRTPNVEDGASMWRLAQESGCLEVNSLYSYLMICRHFPQSCIIAEEGGEAIGFISGHRPNAFPDVVFVWQIGVAPSYRGKGIAVAMLNKLVEQSRGVRYLEATVTTSNEASRRTFRSLAKHLGTGCEEAPCFPRELFGGGDHEAEDLFRIGPIG